MKFKNKQGMYKKMISLENRKKIIDWLKNNPNGTQTQCAIDLGLARETVCKHAKALRGEK